MSEPKPKPKGCKVPLAADLHAFAKTISAHTGESITAVNDRHARRGIVKEYWAIIKAQAAKGGKEA